MHKPSFLCLKENVYIIDGYRHAAIYDLNHGSLYSISKNISELTQRLMLNPFVPENFSREERDVIQHLIELQVLIQSSKKAGKFPLITNLKENFPARFAWIEVTNQCNLECTFCYEESSARCKKEMDFTSFQCAIDNLREANIKRIQFIGGEPLLLKNKLKKMLLDSRKYFEYVEIYSNGMLIDENWCGFFKENNLSVALSIHSYLANEHDNIVNVKGAHKKTTRAVQLLKYHNIPYRIATIKDKRYDVGTHLDNSPYQLTPSNPKLTGRAGLDMYDFDMFKETAITEKKFHHPISKNKVVAAVTGHQCFLKNFYIATDLTVYPCVMERRVSYGHLQETRLTKMLENETRFLTKDKIEGCQDCEYRYACFDCRADSNGNSIHQKPWFCTYDPRKGEWQSVEQVFDQLYIRA